VFPVTVPSTFSIIAHRGASGYAPENTMLAFELARQMGASEMEFDCQLSEDGRVVVCHDPELSRFGYPDVRIAETPAGRLGRLDMGSHLSPYWYSSARMPLVEEVFSAFRTEVTYHVELKSEEPELVSAVLDAIADRRLEENCIIISFHPAQLSRTRDLNERIRIGWSVEQLDERVLAMARELDIDELNPPLGAVTPELVDAAHEFVDEVLVWGIEGAPPRVYEQIERAVAIGCDGAFLNWPDRAVQSAT
jgi:glycerophosphoryl diester phosphodiesterase